jgi:hypothetical protein
MVAENPTWGAPRIHGELRMLGFDTEPNIAERARLMMTVRIRVSAMAEMRALM